MEPLATRLFLSKETKNFWVYKSNGSKGATPAVYVAKESMPSALTEIVVTVVVG